MVTSFLTNPFIKIKEKGTPSVNSKLSLSHSLFIYYSQALVDLNIGVFIAKKIFGKCFLLLILTKRRPR